MRGDFQSAWAILGEYLAGCNEREVTQGTALEPFTVAILINQGIDQGRRDIVAHFEAMDASDQAASAAADACGDTNYGCVCYSAAVIVEKILEQFPDRVRGS